MGQPVTFLRTSSPRRGVIRFELNRTITGMGHEHYKAGNEVIGGRPVDELARRLLATGKLSAVHIYGSVVTAELADADADEGELADADKAAFEEAITKLYTHYLPGVEVPSDEEISAQAAG